MIDDARLAKRDAFKATVFWEALQGLLMGKTPAFKAGAAFERLAAPLFKSFLLGGNFGRPSRNGA